MTCDPEFRANSPPLALAKNDVLSTAVYMTVNLARVPNLSLRLQTNGLLRISRGGSEIYFTEFEWQKITDMVSAMYSAHRTLDPLEPPQ